MKDKNFILHCADLHIGASKHIFTDFDGYLQRQKKMLYEIKRLVEEYKVKYLCICGDVFEKGEPTQNERDTFFKWLIEIDDLGYCTTFIIAGNHDEESSGKTPLDLIYSLEHKFKNTFFRSKPDVIVRDNLAFAMIPWNYDIEVYAEKLKKKLTEKVKKFFVLGHIPLPGITTDTGWFIKGSKKLEKIEFVDNFLLGDIHARHISENGRLQMPGSPIQHNWGDKAPKGVSLIDLKDTNKPLFIELNVPKFEIVKSLKLAKKKAKKGSIVKLVTSDIVEEDLPENVVEVTNTITEEEVLDYKAEMNVLEGLTDHLANKGFNKKQQLKAVKIVEELCKKIH